MICEDHIPVECGFIDMQMDSFSEILEKKMKKILSRLSTPPMGHLICLIDDDVFRGTYGHNQKYIAGSICVLIADYAPQQVS